MANSKPHKELPWHNVCVSMPNELVDQIDLEAKRSDISRSAWVRAAVHEKFERDGVTKPRSKGWKVGEPSNAKTRA